MKKYILTNNPLVQKKLGSVLAVKYVDLDYLGLLVFARDKVHQGATLLTHPLSGSVKPNETPYKSILMSDRGVENTDFKSLQLIESAILTAKKFLADRPDYASQMTAQIKEDCQLIDLTLIQSALPSAGISVF